MITMHTTTSTHENCELLSEAQFVQLVIRLATEQIALYPQHESKIWITRGAEMLEKIYVWKEELEGEKLEDLVYHTKRVRRDIFKSVGVGGFKPRQQVLL